jgi:hypothetical protein
VAEHRGRVDARDSAPLAGGATAYVTKAGSNELGSGPRVRRCRLLQGQTVVDGRPCEPLEGDLVPLENSVSSVSWGFAAASAAWLGPS